MKIEVKTGNLLNVTKGHIVHGCNAQGIMGSGVALAVKNTWPAAFESYRRQYIDDGLKLGVAYPCAVSMDLVIWNAVTQDNFGVGKRQVSYDAVETCFAQINSILTQRGNALHNELHIPLIGAGLGGGNWEIIKTIIEETVTIPITLWILPN
jgi:O-acetyl-ADP-ribose deacetylase (regulator of RNase III)